MLTSTACNLSHFGGKGHVLNSTASPAFKTYSPLILRNRIQIRASNVTGYRNITSNDSKWIVVQAWFSNCHNSNKTINMMRACGLTNWKYHHFNSLMKVKDVLSWWLLSVGSTVYSTMSLLINNTSTILLESIVILLIVIKSNFCCHYTLWLHGNKRYQCFPFVAITAKWRYIHALIPFVWTAMYEYTCILQTISTE